MPAAAFQRISGLMSAAFAGSVSSSLKSLAKASARSTWKARSSRAKSRASAVTSGSSPPWPVAPASVRAAARQSASTAGSYVQPRAEKATRRGAAAAAPATATPSHVCPAGSGGGANSHPPPPSIASRKRPTSRTQRPIGPFVAWRPSRGPEGVAPLRGTRPGDTRKPTTPQNAAGVRNEPPRSEPVASQHWQLASAAAEPPLLPPAVVRVSQGETVVGKSGLKVWEPAANSGTLVLPTTMAPRASSCKTNASLSAAMSSAWSGDPSVKRTPCTAMVSLTNMGSPYKYPGGGFAGCTSREALSRALSRHTIGVACTRASVAERRRAATSTSCPGVTLPARSNATASKASRRCRSGGPAGGPPMAPLGPVPHARVRARGGAGPGPRWARPGPESRSGHRASGLGLRSGPA
mmetsp:Transcript_123286/g.343295  ORF Transcript_123286/g.343295 Transcript_123286/m.343295 type:complete len:409 (+) Transcript_123286:603-1829(+)